MIVTLRFVSISCWVVLASCLSNPLHAEEPEAPIMERLDEIVAWAVADEDAATERLIDCLSDEREIDGKSLQGKAKEAWSFLRSRTNAEISVRDFSVYHLYENPERAKALLAKRIRKINEAYKANSTEHWSPEDGMPVHRLLHALSSIHQDEIRIRGEIADIQLLIEWKRETKTKKFGITATTFASLEIISGYVDHRDKTFAKYLSGKTGDGRDQIAVTRANVVALAEAIRDSKIQDK